jgi:putative transposase
MGWGNRRRSSLCEADSIDLLRESFRYVRQRHPFEIDAAVILPEHFHCIWTLPEGDSDYSMRWRSIESFFSRRCGREHCIRDEQGWFRYVEYIHYNPVRHGLAKVPKDWEYSSFYWFVREGKYDVMWGADTSFQIDEGFE